MQWYRDDVEELSTDDCWALLRGAAVARLAVCVEGHPEIFPINYVVDGETVVFRSAEGTKVSAALAQPQVAVEIDGHDPAAGQAWSVVVKGRAEAVRPGHDLMQALELPLFPWQSGPKNRFLRVLPAAVTGRRFTVTNPQSWNSPLAGDRRTPTGSLRWVQTEEPDQP